MKLIETLMSNWTRFVDKNPEIKEAIKEGYEVAAYDSDTGLIITNELTGGELKVKIIEDSHVIRLDSPNTVNDLVKEAHQNAIDKGWYDEPRSFGECIALMHSELSEALEDHRNGRGFKEFYYEGEKPCGIPTELADTVIRIFDTCGHLGIDLEEAIRIKMEYNSTRPQRHGGKKL